MEIYYGIEGFGKVKKPVVTVGTFDGVHIGHSKIFQTMKILARECGGETVVVTFHPHPRLVIHPDSKDLKFINTQERKYDLISRNGIDHLVVIPFTKEFAATTANTFVEDILVKKIGVCKLVVGYDHHFGRNREGSFEELMKLADKYSFAVEQIPAQDINNIAVSSTKIRKALNEGDIRHANDLLGYEYSITGIVVGGNKIGRDIGFPTANIELQDEYKLITADGVYACRILYDGKIYLGMGNIGYRPTISNSDLTVEVHIFDFDKEIYGEAITIFFVDRIRDEVKFKNLEALKEQLTMDRDSVKIILGG
ncbi:MAG: bifunctional riboflavin kinase/FAD synthetase [Bacteroidales bacterium]|jgi:riboflavin kinase/FMN adenylyltransferase|nr:bifunctional riboflavin kinase/FAD synthetase [Bacteroidales bacterium]